MDVSDCNLADEQAIRKLVRQVQPDVIVNPAAYTAVDKAEAEPALVESARALIESQVEEFPGLAEYLEKFRTWQALGPEEDGFLS